MGSQPCCWDQLVRWLGGAGEGLLTLVTWYVSAHRYFCGAVRVRGHTLRWSVGFGEPQVVGEWLGIEARHQTWTHECPPTL